jgi:hypothetical protein
MFRYVDLTQENPSDAEYLQEQLSRKATNFSSPSFILHRQQQLFRKLDLSGLATCTADHKELYLSTDAAIATRYQTFCEDDALYSLFPSISGLQGFFRAVKSCLSYFGYRLISKRIRVQSDRPMPNGKNRDGTQRYSDSTVKYFVGWMVREQSGSDFERTNWDEVIGAVSERLEVIRRDRKHRKSRDKGNPGLIAA